MKILALIPARGGSKGVPGKNIRLLQGKPLLQYAVEAALSSRHITRTIVSTDDVAIQQVALAVGAAAPFLRPAALAQDDTPTLPVVQHALQWLGENEQQHYDFVCLLQPTSPFRPAGFIDRAVLKLLDRGADSLVSVLPVPPEYNPHWAFEPDADGMLRIATGETQIIPRRQALPAAFFRDGALYLSKTSAILQENSLYGKRIAYLESDPAYHCNIDTMDDWQQAEQMAERLCAG